jgi:hypothetical protein
MRQERLQGAGSRAMGHNAPLPGKTQSDDALTRPSESKLRDLARADAWVRRALTRRSYPAPRVFTYPLGRDIERLERQRMLQESVLAPDEYATYALVREVMRRCPRAEQPEDADVVFVPAHVAAYDTDGPYELRDLIACLETIDGGLPHVICSIGDYHPRRPGRHSNPHSIPGDPANPWAWKYRGEYDWLDEQFIVVTPESTLDLSPQDIGVPVLIRRRVVRPSSKRRPLLYSFAGQIDYENARPKHVRGRENMPIWEQLMAGNADGKSFVGTEAMLAMHFGPGATARVLPASSVFTLCPAGWARWTFRLSEAVLAGSIPVILSDFYLKPFSDQIPWDTFAVTLPESSLADVPRILSELSPARVRWLQQNLERNQHHFTAQGLADRFAASLRAVTTSPDRDHDTSAARVIREGISRRP